MNKLNEEAEWSYKNKYPVFIVLTYGDNPLGIAISKVTGDDWTHCLISFEPELDMMYSFATRTQKHNYHQSLFGFVYQGVKDKWYKTKQTKYQVYVMYVSKAAKDAMKNRLQYFISNEKQSKYDFLGLLKIAVNKDTEDHQKYFCSRFVAEILGQGIPLEKLPSLYRPQELMNLNNISLVNQGKNLYEYNPNITKENMKKIKNNDLENRIYQENELPSMRLSDKNLFVSYNEPKYPSKNGVNGKDDGVWNSYVMYDDKYYRERVEGLIIRDNKVFLSKANGNNWRIPGGSTEPNETVCEQLVNECKEEARICIKNPEFIGTYIKDFDKESNYWKDLPFKYSGYYIHLYIAEYDKSYTGHIDEVDEDKNMIKYGKWFNLDDEDMLNNIDTHWIYALEKYKNKKLNEDMSLDEFNVAGVNPVSTMGKEPIQRPIFGGHQYLPVNKDDIEKDSADDILDDDEEDE